MKSSGLMLAAVTVVFAAVASSFFVGKGNIHAATAVRPEVRIGDQGPGPTLPAGSNRWTPKHDPNGFTVTHNLPLYDSRVGEFADFPLLLPAYLPKGAKMHHATIVLDPKTHKRIIQIIVEGKHVGILSEQRVSGRDATYPDGIIMRSEGEADGSVSRTLRSNVDGVGVSMAWSLSMSDDEIIKCFQSLKTPSKF